MTYLYNRKRKLNSKFSADASLPMVVRLGHYYFDNKPIIGKIVDFHMWDRCKQYRYNKKVCETEHLES